MISAPSFSMVVKHGGVMRNWVVLSLLAVMVSGSVQAETKAEIERLYVGQKLTGQKQPSWLTQKVRFNVNYNVGKDLAVKCYLFEEALERRGFDKAIKPGLTAGLFEVVSLEEAKKKKTVASLQFGFMENYTYVKCTSKTRDVTMEDVRDYLKRGLRLQLTPKTPEQIEEEEREFGTPSSAENSTGRS